MHLLVAIPGQHYVAAISPLLAALGEPIVPFAMDQLSAAHMQRPALTSALHETMQAQTGPAVFPTCLASPWAVFDATIKGTSDRRALVFYEPAELGIARELEAGSSIHEATDKWVTKARTIIEFTGANKTHVTLANIEASLSVSRVFLQSCADLFLFDLVDLTCKPNLSRAPSTAHRLVARYVLSKTSAVQTLDKQLSEHALALTAHDESHTDNIEQFLTDYHKGLQDQRTLTRVKNEADALRAANKVAEQTVHKLRTLVATLETVHSSNGADASINDTIQLRKKLSDILTIAETNVLEVSTLKKQAAEDRRKIATLQSDLKKPHNKNATTAPANPLTTNKTRKTPPAKPDLWTRFRLLRWLNTHRNVNLIEKSDLFDPIWYAENNPDLQAQGVSLEKHFVVFGGKEKRAPGPKFSSRHYLAKNPDVAASGVNPLIHYLRIGKAEGREIRPAEK